MTRKRPKTKVPSADKGYGTALADVVDMIESARRAAARSVNSIMTATYWAIGRRIVEHEQHGARRAGYGEELLKRLSEDLTTRFGRGFGRANLFQMKAFFLAYRGIVQTLSGQSGLAAVAKLPDEKTLEAEVDQTQRELELRRKR